MPNVRPKTAGRPGGQVTRDPALCAMHARGVRRQVCEGPLDADGLCAVHGARLDLIATADTIRREAARGRPGA